VPKLCGQCHEPIRQQYATSIHGQAIARGNSQAPVCTDCHGIHSIRKPSDPKSAVSATAQATYTCARCHESVRLTREFGIPGERAGTYYASYHGMAAKLGSTTAANCASCHGAHTILPSSDPKSSISQANLAKTCGQCHVGVTEKFARGKIHLTNRIEGDTASKAVGWVRRIYLMLIIFPTIGAMVAHNALLWRRKALAARARQSRTATRLTVLQRTQHATLVISFFTLVLTGFALKYPDSWLAIALGMNETVRGIVHRIAGCVLVGVGIFHVVYVWRKDEGRRFLFGLIPSKRDISDILANVAYMFGLRRNQPKFGAFTYGEKAEYWALVWGTIVMALTGFVIWFKVLAAHFLARWWIDVATAVHFYEAILATLAIVVWHLYQVIFDPDTYPMNWAWFDGKVEPHHLGEQDEFTAPPDTGSADEGQK
jgi:formate dehydrogenase gamma subunit